MQLEVAVSVSFGPLDGLVVQRTGAFDIVLPGEDHGQHEPFVGVAAVADFHGVLDDLVGFRQVAVAVRGEGQRHKRPDAAGLGLAVVDLLRGHVDQPLGRLEGDLGLAEFDDRAEEALPGRVLKDRDVVGVGVHRRAAQLDPGPEMRGRRLLVAVPPEFGAEMESPPTERIPARGRRPLGE